VVKQSKRVALVTGGGRGIGRGIAECLAESGFDLAINGVRDASQVADTVAALEKLGAAVVYCQGNVADAADRQTIVDAVRQRFGRLDVLVNNAGRAGQTPFLDMTEEDWDRVLDTNLRGVFLCCRAAAGQMVRQGGGGKIINITSALGIKGARNSAHYAASKGGVVALTRSLASELAPHRIEVTAAGPGQTDTPMWRSMYSREEQALRKQAGQVQAPEAFTHLVLFLASEAGNGWSGQVIAKGVYVPT